MNRAALPVTASRLFEAWVAGTRRPILPWNNYGEKEVIDAWTWIRTLRGNCQSADVYFWAAMSALHLRVDPSGRCFVGSDLWAREAHINKRTLRRCRDQAIAWGWLQCPPIRPRTKTIYRICVPPGVPIWTKTQEEKSGARDIEGGDESGAPRVLQITENWGTQSATDLSDTRIKDPPQRNWGTQSATDSFLPESESGALGQKSGAPRVPYKLNSEAQNRERGKTLSADWLPNSETEAAARQQRPDLDQALMIRMFKNHHRASGSEFLDWDAAYLVWIDRERKSQAIGSDAAAGVWNQLIQSGGKLRDPRIQCAIDAVGGWSAIVHRTQRDADQIRQKFCSAYLEAKPNGAMH